METAPNTGCPVDNVKEQLYAEIRDFIAQRNYPCIAALKALQLDEIRLGVYRDFGSCTSGPRLREDLHAFMREQEKSGSEYLTFWAVFAGDDEFSEEDFELGLWRELSGLTSSEEMKTDWGTNNADPDSKDFSFCLFGEPFFVVGLHSRSSRPGRRFGRPSLIFNIFRQFETIEQKGFYDAMVRTNRARDVKFAGNVNPMVKNHGDKWEAIQFSGKDNPEQWKCPFHFRSGTK